VLKLWRPLEIREAWSKGLLESWSDGGDGGPMRHLVLVWPFSLRGGARRAPLEIEVGTAWMRSR
jgi:hypothetical protein